MRERESEREREEEIKERNPARIARDGLRGCWIINERRSRSLLNGALIFVPRGSNE